MRKQKKRLKENSLRKIMKGNALVPLLFVVIAFGILLTSGAMYNKSATNPKEEYGEATVASGSGKQNIQLKDLSFTAKPTPNTGACAADSGQIIDPDCVCPDAHITCKDGKCIEIVKDKSGPGYQNYTCDQFGQYACAYPAEDGDRCWGKPVIYLYPTTPTLVDVTVATNGKIVVSNPHYPSGGWKDVLAYPSGDLEYQNNHYNELFYETSTSEIQKPNQGFVFKTDELPVKLLEFINKLGLTKQNEQQEFLDWWVPRLEALNSPYIFVSLVRPEDKIRYDNVIVSPKPDTFINFIVYFKPMVTDEKVAPLALPDTPKRLGFTAVEWGGVIDR